ncbi:MAG: ATP-binding cassette domain-containing protein [Gammaproteobacteria bacterium]|nr:ATP-binding cassette domain-containing protein [Gammaproteobacteria bacterium]
MGGAREVVVEVRGLTTRLDGVTVHEALDLDVRRGEVLAIVGGSGTGKTTLLRAMVMLLRPAAGTVRLLGEDVRGASPAEASRLRERIGVTFQHGALFSSLSVLENVALPLREHTALPPALVRDIARLKLSLAGLPASAADKQPGELSGGMTKRAAVARALALDPEVLFLDEPTAGLDPDSASAFDELVLDLRDSLGLTVVMVTHDLDTLWRTADRVAFLGERRVIALDTMRGLCGLDHPLVKSFFDGPRGRAARECAWKSG